MRQFKLFISLVILILVVVFVLQNAMQIKVSLWFWDIESSLALILFATLILGIVVGFLFSFSNKKKVNKEVKIKNIDNFETVKK